MSLEDKVNNNIIDENRDEIINHTEINNHILSYKKDLWMYFESINSKFLNDRQKIKSLMYIISQKNNLVEEYSQNLDLLYNQFYIELSYFTKEDNINNQENNKYTYDMLVNTFLENIKNESKFFKEYSEQIKNELLNKLEENIKLQYEMNSKLNEFYKEYENKFKKVLENIMNFKEEYDKAGKNVEKSKKDYEILKEEIETQKEKNEAINLKYKKCKEENNLREREAKEKQKIYEDYIVEANKEREKYIESTEKVYDLAQQLDKEYIELIKKNMSFLLNSKNELFNNIIKENKNILKIINSINFNFELEQFANSKSPKFYLPKPFVYEQYNPYLFLRERSKADYSKIRNHDIFKIIVNDLNHLFFSEKKKLNKNDDDKKKKNDSNDENNNFNNNITIKEMDYIRNVVHEIWNAKKIDFKELNKLLKKEDLRIIILREINQYRIEGIFILDEVSYENLASVFNIVLNISKKVKDYESIKNCMILSQTFYKSLDDKIMIQKELMKNDIWKKKIFWEEIIEFSIIDEINYAKGFLVFLGEKEEARKERVKNSVNGVLITFLYNMKLFDVPKKESEEIINIFLKKYEIEDNILLHNKIEVNEISDGILEESIANNLNIEPIEEENQIHE